MRGTLAHQRLDAGFIGTDMALMAAALIYRAQVQMRREPAAPPPEPPPPLEESRQVRRARERHEAKAAAMAPQRFPGRHSKGSL